MTPTPPPAPSSPTPRQQSSKTKSLFTSANSPKEELFIPEYIHKNVGYSARSDTSLSSLPIPHRKAFHLVTEHYVIPENFEQDHRYGPKSGSTYEGRVLGAYQGGMLEAKGAEVKICLLCGAEGHKKKACPLAL